MAKIVATVFISIANLINTLFALGITFLLFVFAALNGDSGPSSASIVFMVALFIIIALAWFSSYQIFFRNRFKWLIVLAIVGCLDLIGARYSYEGVSNSYIKSSSLELMMKWEVWIFILPAILYGGSALFVRHVRKAKN